MAETPDAATLTDNEVAGYAVRFVAGLEPMIVGRLLATLTERTRERDEARASVESGKRMYRAAAGRADNLYDALFAANAKTIAAERERDALREALEIIAGLRQCADNLMSNVEVARAALAPRPPVKEE